jgi:hypothetical protein
LGALGIVLRVVLQTKEHEVVEGAIRRVVVQMRDLALFDGGVALKAPTEAAPPATFLQHLRFDTWRDGLALGHRVAPVKR